LDHGGITTCCHVMSKAALTSPTTNALTLHPSAWSTSSVWRKTARKHQLQLARFLDI
jgi:hypothetical protein